VTTTERGIGSSKGRNSHSATAMIALDTATALTTSAKSGNRK
jgi:hypothetical protein